MFYFYLFVNYDKVLLFHFLNLVENFVTFLLHPFYVHNEIFLLIVDELHDEEYLIDLDEYMDDHHHNALKQNPIKICSTILYFNIHLLCSFIFFLTKVHI